MMTAKKVSDHEMRIADGKSPTYVSNSLNEINRRTVSKIKDDMLTYGLPARYRVLIERIDE